MTRSGRIRDAGRMRAATQRILAITFSALLVTTACSSTSDTTPPATTATNPTTTTTSEAPTTTSALATTTEAPPDTTEPVPTTTTPPPATNPGDPNWVEIVQELLVTLHSINEKPVASRIDEFCLPGENDCQSTFGQDIQAFIDNGWHTQGVPDPIVLTAELTSTAEDLPVDEAFWVLIRATTAPEDLTDAAIVDENGEVVLNIVGAEPNGAESLDIYLVQGAGGWRVLSIPPPE